MLRSDFAKASALGNKPRTLNTPVNSLATRFNMVDQLKLYLFGDQTYDIQPHLKDLLRYRHNPILENFLIKAYDAIRIEIYRLPSEIRDGLPRFTCLDDLVLGKQGEKRCIPLDMAVTCMYQLGVFIRCVVLRCNGNSS